MRAKRAEPSLCGGDGAERFSKLAPGRPDLRLVLAGGGGWRNDALEAANNRHEGANRLGQRFERRVGRGEVGDRY